mmetsp:Transcript_74404/g.198837  ORF Transcript_74404/g.198837 Transcript_74404/m.198837 type:complete len:245 (-) Transcript_74404:261-995(-)
MVFGQEPPSSCPHAERGHRVRGLQARRRGRVAAFRQPRSPPPARPAAASQDQGIGSIPRRHRLERRAPARKAVPLPDARRALLRHHEELRGEQAGQHLLRAGAAAAPGRRLARLRQHGAPGRGLDQHRQQVRLPLVRAALRRPRLPAPGRDQRPGRPHPALPRRQPRGGGEGAAGAVLRAGGAAQREAGRRARGPGGGGGALGLDRADHHPRPRRPAPPCLGEGGGELSRQDAKGVGGGRPWPA